MHEDEPISSCQTTTTCGANHECTAIGSMQLCCPTVSYICSSAGGRTHDANRNTGFDAGVTVKKTFFQNYATSHRYYYDTEHGRCIAFTYNGALGNFNNFKTSADCEMFCAKLQCTYGK